MNKLTSYLKLALAGWVGWSSRAGRAADTRLKSSASAAWQVRHRRPLSLLLEWLDEQGGRKRWRLMADSA